MIILMFTKRLFNSVRNGGVIGERRQCPSERNSFCNSKNAVNANVTEKYFAERFFG
jgi:hypothetical protein